MGIIDVNLTNIDQEHICCAISDKKGEHCLRNRKNWMKEQFEDGLKFKKADINGKVFIEYIPAENAWCPIEAPDYLFIKCFWVSGQYQGKGYANLILNECIQGAQNQGKAGLTILSATKKLPFLSDPKYLKHKGFVTCDTAQPNFELMYLPFTDNHTKPSLKACCKSGIIPEEGYVLYYSDQCPYAEKYSFLLSELGKEHNTPVTIIKITSKEQAQQAPTPFTIYSLYLNGKFVTNEILSGSKFLKIIGVR